MYISCRYHSGAISDTQHSEVSQQPPAPPVTNHTYLLQSAGGFFKQFPRVSLSFGNPSLDKLIACETKTPAPGLDFRGGFLLRSAPMAQMAAYTLV